MPRRESLIRWGLIISILWLMKIGLLIAIPIEPTSNQGSAQSASDLAHRVTQLEGLYGASNLSSDQGQKASQALAQSYTAEYSAIMSRILAWASLQYALFPILIAVFAILTKLDSWPVKLRWWIAVGTLLVGFSAYQGTMLDTLQNVLLIERYLRPLARLVVGTDQFWIHECLYRRIQAPNMFYWKYWPPLICFVATMFVVGFLKVRYRLQRWDYVFAVLAVLFTAGILYLTVQGSQIEGQISDICKKNFSQTELAVWPEGGQPGWPSEKSAVPPLATSTVMRHKSQSGTSTDYVYWTFSAAAQSISAFVAFLLTGYTLVHALMEAARERDDSLEEIHSALRFSYHSRMTGLAWLTGAAIVLSLGVVYFNRPNAEVPGWGLAIVAAVDLAAILGGLLFVISIVDPRKYQKIAERVLEKAKVSVAISGDAVPAREFFDEFLHLEKLVRDYLRKNELYVQSRGAPRMSYSFRQMIEALFQNEKIDRAFFEELLEISKYRNLVFHGHLDDASLPMLQRVRSAAENIKQLG